MTNTDLSIIKECMTSRDLSVFTGKRHSSVLRDIREMGNMWEKVTGNKFVLSDYTDLTGRKLPMYQLKKDEILFIASKYNDELRAKIITRLVFLENERSEREKSKMEELQRQAERLYDKSDREALYRR